MSFININFKFNDFPLVQKTKILALIFYDFFLQNLVLMIKNKHLSPLHCPALPLPLKDLVNSEPVLRVGLQTALDQILGWLGDVAPLGGQGSRNHTVTTIAERKDSWFRIIFFLEKLKL